MSRRAPVRRAKRERERESNLDPSNYIQRVRCHIKYVGLLFTSASTLNVAYSGGVSEDPEREVSVFELDLVLGLGLKVDIVCLEKKKNIVV